MASPTAKQRFTLMIEPEVYALLKNGSEKINDYLVHLYRWRRREWQHAWRSLQSAGYKPLQLLAEVQGLAGQWDMPSDTPPPAGYTAQAWEQVRTLAAEYWGGNREVALLLGSDGTTRAPAERDKAARQAAERIPGLQAKPARRKRGAAK